ncbi:O-methyltransferase [Saccharopolyspora sp. ASAGF58]|uniref:O-methyltransferase n=1 Tax=Saccharopolyspora sp. ASAGF58 TaxID=2719023 RepID=UPI00143FE458|nr:O-methyltransferase [Saccharopolyspora sp. ASAGF58]QIZ34088.1 O-methyltransferase [Saccharopolyspora sp. ASAGF58]
MTDLQSPDLKTIVMNQRRYEYLLRQTEPPTQAQQWLIDQTNALGASAEMQIPHEQGVLLTLLVQLTGASRVVEIGTFTGYSTLAMARGLGADGQIVTCDLSSEWTEIAQQAWEKEGVADRIEVRLGQAADTLRAMPKTEHIDMVFIDADKVSYQQYWELLVPRMRPGGLLLADNTFYYGEAADDFPTGNAKAIDEFNSHVRADDRVESVMLPIADGLIVARKRTKLS